MESKKCFYQAIVQANGSSHGLGDLIRGMLVCSKIAGENNMEHIVLTKEHPIGQHLEYTYEDESLPKILHLSDNPVILASFKEGSDTLRDIALTGNHKVYTNFDYKLAYLKSVDHLISEEYKERVKKILNPNSASQVKLNKIKESLPPKYEILHFRFGDATHNYVSRAKIELCKQFILRKHRIHNYELPLIVCCDSDAIKKSLPPEILVIPIEPVHIGNSKNPNKVLDTLIEYWIIANSKRIISYTTYSWISGFVRWVSWLNNIPIEGYVKLEYDKPASGNKV